MATATRKRGKSATSQDNHVLSHGIPKKVFADNYVSRTIKGVKDIDLLRYSREARNNVMLYGPTGPGKTSLVLAYAATEQLPLVTVQANGAVDPNTFFGGWQPRVGLSDERIKEVVATMERVRTAMPDGTPADQVMAVTMGLIGRDDFQWQDSEITNVIRYGGVLYIDEVNFLPPKVASTFHGLLDLRRQITILEKGNEVIDAHPELQVIVAYNPDYEGTRPLNAAFKNRFKIKVRFDYDRNVEEQLVYLPVMLDVAEKLRVSHRAGDVETPVSTNMLIEFEELAVDLGYEFAVENFLNAFHDDERSAVRDVIELHSATIMEQLAEMERLAEEEGS